MTTHADIRTELLRLLDEDPEFRQTVRRHLLTEDLINLPEQHAAFVAYVSAFIDEQRQANTRYDEFIDEQRQANTRYDEFIDEQRQANARYDEFIDEQRQTNAEQRQFNLEQRRQNASVNSRLEGLAKGQQTLQDQIRQVQAEVTDYRGERASRATYNKAGAIARQLGMRLRHRWNDDDIAELLYHQDLSHISDGDVQSFENADLIIEAGDANQVIHMVAVEASHRADRSDTRRAIRNAQMLHQFTGRPALAVISCLSNDQLVEQQVSDGQIIRHRLSERDLHPR